MTSSKQKLVFLSILSVCLFLGYAIFNQLKKDFAAFTWNKSSCHIQQSEVIYTQQETSDGCSYKLSFDYYYDGIKRTGNKWALDEGQPFAWCSDALIFASNYPKNSTVECYIDPNNPSNAVLSKGNLFSILGLLVPIILFLIGIFAIQAFSGKFTNVSTAIGLRVTRIIAICLFLIGTFSTIYTGFMPIIYVVDATDWAPVECKIISSYLRTYQKSMSGNQPTSSAGYKLNIVYSYQFNNQSYISDRFDFVQWGTSNVKTLSKIADQYPIESTQTCFVNPKKNYISVIDKDYGSKYLRGFFPLIASFAGIIVFFLTRLLKQQN